MLDCKKQAEICFVHKDRGERLEKRKRDRGSW